MAMTDPNKPKNIYNLLLKILIFDAIMRITPPLSLFAVSIVAVAAYKASPKRAKKKIKSAVFDIRKNLSDWINPENIPDKDTSEKDPDDYVFNEDGDIEQKAKRNMERNDMDDKSYPPETA